jgi:hypothetical protein
MGHVKVIPATPDGLLKDVRVIAFHGHLHADATPARCGPILADADDCMLRIVEARPAADGFDVMVEVAHPPLAADGELPGHGTRVGPWQARLDHHIVVLGPSEIDRVDRLKRRSELAEPPTVERFVRWLMVGQGRSDDLPCERLKDAVAWYCSKQESFALFHRIHGVAEDEFFETARLFRSARPGATRRLEDASWWLSRAALGKEDIYRAAAGLRRAGSTSWRTMLREGLRLPT